MEFKNLNVNPKNRKTGDCSTRALSTVLKISYEEVLELQYNKALETYYDQTSKQVIERILSDFGFIKMKQPRKSDNTKYLVCEIDKLTTLKTRQNGILITVANHHTAVVGNEIIDTWNCSDKTIGNYYIKQS